MQSADEWPATPGVDLMRKGSEIGVPFPISWHKALTSSSKKIRYNILLLWYADYTKPTIFNSIKTRISDLLELAQIQPPILLLAWIGPGHLNNYQQTQDSPELVKSIRISSAIGDSIQQTQHSHLAVNDGIRAGVSDKEVL